jgi:hypothetical protein
MVVGSAARPRTPLILPRRVKSTWVAVECAVRRHVRCPLEIGGRFLMTLPDGLAGHERCALGLLAQNIR